MSPAEKLKRYGITFKPSPGGGDQADTHPREVRGAPGGPKNRSQTGKCTAFSEKRKEKTTFRLRRYPKRGEYLPGGWVSDGLGGPSKKEGGGLHTLKRSHIGNKANFQSTLVRPQISESREITQTCVSCTDPAKKTTTTGPACAVSPAPLCRQLFQHHGISKPKKTTSTNTQKTATVGTKEGWILHICTTALIGVLRCGCTWTVKNNASGTDDNPNRGAGCVVAEGMVGTGRRPGSRQASRTRWRLAMRE